MIGPWYHLLAVTAVATAAAVGVALGSAVVEGPAGEDPRAEARSLRTSNTQLRARLAALKHESADRERYVREAAPMLLDETLSGTRVLVLAAPGANRRHVDAVAGNLRLADAAVAGPVTVTAKLTDPAYGDDARDLATRLLPPNVTDIPADADGVAASTALLAAVLLTHEPGIAAGDRTAALAGYRAEQLIEFDGEPGAPADAVILVAGPPASGEHAAARGEAVLTLVAKFAGSAPAVLAADGARRPVTQVRREASLRRVVSTVDDLGSALGQLSAVLAAAERTGDRETGHYGVGSGAQGRIPKPTAR